MKSAPFRIRFVLSLASAMILVLHVLSAPLLAMGRGDESMGSWKSLFDGKTLDHWKPSTFGGDGEITVKDGAIYMEMGNDLTGITWQGEPPVRLDYEITLEAQRVDGNDFFCGLTFPVADDPCTLIVGGWGGGLTGLSSLDGLDASENQFGQWIRYENGRWYRIRLRVTKENISAWLDDKRIIVCDIAGYKISIRPEVVLSKPLGIACWQTTAAIRNIRLRKLAKGDAVSAREAHMGPSRPINVFVAGAEEIEGVDNAAEQYAQYREQNVIKTGSGKIVVVCQGRNKSKWSDRSGQDLVVKTSSDSGRTWTKARLIATHGLKSICPNAAVYDLETNRIHVLYNLFTWDYTRVPDDIKGEMGDLYCRQFSITSDDEGRTWSAPRDISSMIDTKGAVMVVGSGEGIQLRHGPCKGRLIFGGGDFYQGKKVLCFYSDDHGKTWKRGSAAPFEGRMAWASESKVAELPDGTLILNSRTFVDQGGKQRLRTRAFSRDGGITWSRLENDPTLETVSCNGSLIAVEHPKGKDGAVLLCSVPAGPRRTHGTVYASFDHGKTWPIKKVLVSGEFAYSSLIDLPDGSIGLFYETRGHQDIMLVRFGLDWLIENDERSGRPNVLLITSEDNGPEIGCYGDPFVRTPHLDSLAAEGVRFQNAYITNPVCSPSRGTIFTGLYPHQNGQIGLATHKYAMFESWPNIVSILKEAGYRTGIIGKIHVNPESAFPCDFRALPGSNFNMRDMKKFAAAAKVFIAESSKPFFLMVNFPDAHLPLIKQYAGLPEEPLDGEDVKTLPWVGADSERLREATANYYNCLERLDAGFGMLMEVLEHAGCVDDTLIIYLGDHGAQFSRGKCCLYEAGVRVPFLVKWPGRTRAGLVRKELISSIDILPTVLDAAGLEGPGNLPGKSLLPLCRGEEVAWRQYAFTEKDGCAPFWTHPRRSVRDQRYKLVLNLRQDGPDPVVDAYRTQKKAHFKAGTSPEELAAAPEHVQKAYAVWEEAPPVELYDLKEDPFEWANLAGKPEYAEVEQRLMTALEQWQKRTRDPLADPARLNMLIDEMDGVVREKIDYRRLKDFRWKYLDYLHPDSIEDR